MGDDEPPAVAAACSFFAAAGERPEEAEAAATGEDATTTLGPSTAAAASIEEPAAADGAAEASQLFHEPVVAVATIGAVGAISSCRKLAGEPDMGEPVAAATTEAVSMSNEPNWSPTSTPEPASASHLPICKNPGAFAPLGAPRVGLPNDFSSALSATVCAV